jgi:hypothetical protein
MVLRQIDESGGPARGASVIAGWDTDCNKLVRDNA